MTRSTKLMIPAVLAAAAIAAFWFLLLAPKREEMAKLDTDIAAQVDAAQQAETQAANYAKAKDNYRENYTEVARLGKAVPADDDVRSLLVQLDDAARRAKVEFRSLNVSSGSSGSTTGQEAAKEGTIPGAVPVGSAGFSSMPFTFAFSGSYFRLSDFFSRMERFVTVQNEKIGVTGRLLLLGNISVSNDADTGKLKAEVGAATYLVPPTEGVPGAPTPAPAAAASASAASPDAGGSTVPNTSATITGVP